MFILLAELNINNKSLNFTISPMDVTKSLDLTDKIFDIANRYYIPPIGPIWNEVFPKEFQRIGKPVFC